MVGERLKIAFRPRFCTRTHMARVYGRFRKARSVTDMENAYNCKKPLPLVHGTSVNTLERVSYVPIFLLYLKMPITTKCALSNS